MQYINIIYIGTYDIFNFLIPLYVYIYIVYKFPFIIYSAWVIIILRIYRLIAYYKYQILPT